MQIQNSSILDNIVKFTIKFIHQITRNSKVLLVKMIFFRKVPITSKMTTQELQSYLLYNMDVLVFSIVNLYYMVPLMRGVEHNRKDIAELELEKGV